MRKLIPAALIAAAVFPAAAQARFTTGISGSVATPAPASSGDAGFQWDDAGIGGAVTAALLTGAAGTAGLARRRRTAVG
jgi:hypothetical protein